ncbi:hypothetical protein AAMO2058_001356000 [Amorphochlora amoebiformis]
MAKNMVYDLESHKAMDKKVSPHLRKQNKTRNSTLPSSPSPHLLIGYYRSKPHQYRRIYHSKRCQVKLSNCNNSCLRTYLASESNNLTQLQPFVRNFRFLKYCDQSELLVSNQPLCTPTCEGTLNKQPINKTSIRRSIDNSPNNLDQKSIDTNVKQMLDNLEQNANPVNVPDLRNPYDSRVIPLRRLAAVRIPRVRNTYGKWR